jgi:hypothetical protein
MMAVDKSDLDFGDRLQLKLRQIIDHISFIHCLFQ